MSIGKANFRQCSLLTHFNQPRAIKVAASFLKNTQNEFHTSSHHEDYDLERAVKTLHLFGKEKRRYK